MHGSLTAHNDNLSEENSSFNVLIIYEDFESGKAGKRTYDFLVENLQEDCEFKSQMWKFDILSIPKLRKMAVTDALEADIIMVASRGGALPEPVKLWCEEWSRQSTRAFALVLLINRELDEISGAATYLRNVAARAGIEFFDHPEEIAHVSAQARPLVPDHNRIGERALNTLAGVVQKEKDVAGSRWGFNE